MKLANFLADPDVFFTGQQGVDGSHPGGVSHLREAFQRQVRQDADGDGDIYVGTKGLAIRDRFKSALPILLPVAGDRSRPGWLLWPVGFCFQKAGNPLLRESLHVFGLKISSMGDRVGKRFTRRPTRMMLLGQNVIFVTWE